VSDVGGDVEWASSFLISELGTGNVSELLARTTIIIMLTVIIFTKRQAGKLALIYTALIHTRLNLLFAQTLIGISEHSLSHQHSLKDSGCCCMAGFSR
jgi:hypothetical protein